VAVCLLFERVGLERQLNPFGVDCGFWGRFEARFYRVEGALVFRLNTTWIVSIVALVAAIVLDRDVCILTIVGYRDALWWEFAWQG